MELIQDGMHDPVTEKLIRYWLDEHFGGISDAVKKYAEDEKVNPDHVGGFRTA